MTTPITRLERYRCTLLMLATVALLLGADISAASGATFTVTSTGDQADFSTADPRCDIDNTAANGDQCTLRAAIQQANATAGADTIAFAIPTSDLNYNATTGVFTITPAPVLPAISGPVTINGYTQLGASANTLAVGNNAVLLIELRGTSAGGSGLIITGGASTIRGLVINRFGSQFNDSGIFLQSDNNVIAGNFIGVNPAGTVELGNASGVRVVTGVNNLIGGTTPAARNVISANGPAQSSLGNVVVNKTFLGSDLPPTGTIIRGNYIGTNAAGTVAVHPQAFQSSMGVVVLDSRGTIIGGSDADDGSQDGNVGARNVISGNADGIRTDEIGTTYPADVTVQGNFIGVDATGNGALANFGDGIRFSPQRERSDNLITVGGTAAGAGNVISGNIGNGVLISNSNVVIQGNRIGTNLAGTLDLGNGSFGVQLTRGGSPPFPSVQFTIGGPTSAARNIISGNGGTGVRVNNLSGSTTVQGNFIGTQSDGASPLGNDFDGIEVNETATIGGTGAGEGNVIAHNGMNPQFGSTGAGVAVPTTTGVPIRGNSIFSNRGLGIDLSSNGLTPNDTGDGDTGANNHQNFPVITGASSAGGSATIQGTLNSTSGTTFRVEFFASPACDVPSGHGEGQTFLGFANVTTNGSGNAAISATLPVTVPGGQIVTSTATDPQGNTSEFSSCQTTPPPPPAGSLQFSAASYAVNENGGSVTITVTRTGGSTGAVSVTYATSNGTAAAGSDYTATSGTLTFADGETSKTFSVAVLDDALDEPDETVNLTLSSPAGGATLGTSTAVLTITDNDPAGFTITGRARDLNGTGIAGVTVALSGAQSATATTDAEGRYAFTALPGGGSHTVTPAKPRFTFTPPSASFGNLSANQTADFLGAPGFFTRYFAEGATGTFFDLSLALLNATAVPADVTLKFQKPDGTVLTQAMTLNPLARATVNPELIPGLEAADFSTVVEADVPVITDRTMRWDARGYGSHAETSIASPALTWYLAEGATISGFDLFYLIQNPNATAATVQVTYLLPAPTPPIVKTYSVGPNSRFNIWVNLADPVLDEAEVSAVLAVTNNVPVIVERAMYRPTGGLVFGAGHESAGVTTPATSWYLAEGATGSFFDLFILIANPNATDAAVEARYLLPDGTVLTKLYTVARNSRFNIWVDLEDARLADTAVSTTIASTNGVPLIVERAMWWPGPASNWQEGHNSPGALQTGTKWGLADGEVGGAFGTETYILIANTSTVGGSARVRLFFEDGTTAERTFTLNPSSRFNVAVGVDFPGALGKRFGTIVESLGATPAQIVVERAMYSNAIGVTWAAGTNVVGTRLQ